MKGPFRVRCGRSVTSQKSYHSVYSSLWPSSHNCVCIFVYISLLFFVCNVLTSHKGFIFMNCLRIATSHSLIFGSNRPLQFKEKMSLHIEACDGGSDGVVGILRCNDASWSGLRRLLMLPEPACGCSMCGEILSYRVGGLLHLVRCGGGLCLAMAMEVYA
jgi:hypothetical protein